MRLHPRYLRPMLRGGSLLFLGLMVFLATPIARAMQLRLEPDQSKLISLAGQPSTVIVGNPVNADVTVLDNKILVQGRGFGKTSVIVLDSKGKQIANLDVIVSNSGKDRLTVYKNGERFSYVCLPECERTLNIGDNDKYSSMLASQIRQKLEIAKTASQIGQ
jgi:hypothetical protein